MPRVLTQCFRDLATVDGVGTRRFGHRIGFPLLTAFLGILWIQEIVSGFLNPVDVVALPVLTALLAIAAIRAWRSPTPSILWERIVFLVGLIFLVGVMAASLAFGTVQHDLSTHFAYLPLAYVAAVLTLGPRHGGRLSLFTYGVSIVILGLGAVREQIEWTQFISVALRDPLLIGLVTAMAVSYREQATQRARLTSEAHLDPLTLAMNRRGALTHLDRIRTPYALLIVDLDGFKRINDHHGHEMGDRVLRRCAHAFRNVLRPEDLLIRWGGDEFVVLTTRTSEIDAGNMARRLQRAARRVGRMMELPVDASIGFAHGESDTPWRTVLQQADQEMYRVKERRRNMAIPFSVQATPRHPQPAQ